MSIAEITRDEWSKVKEIYLEAFPKRERKPFFNLKHSVKKGKVKIFTAKDEGETIGFIAAIPYKDMVMIDYLAVSQKIRSKGTGSKLINEACKYFDDKKIVLLIEKPDEKAENAEQRVARKRFYNKNGFENTDFNMDGTSGEMEILTKGGTISREEYLDLQEYALGKVFFKLSGIKVI